MIIQHDLLRKDYQEKVLEGFRGGEPSRGLYRCPNPDCRSGCFHRHGSYQRYFLDLDIDWSEEFSAPSQPKGVFNERSIQISQMEVLRIKCTGCGMTHAVLPGDAIPFFSGSLLLVLLLMFHLSRESNDTLDEKSVLHSTATFSWEYMKYLAVLFSACRNRMLAALRLGGPYAQSRNPSDADLLHIYLTPPFLSCSCISYFRTHKEPMFVKRRSTVSYPLRFLFRESLIS